MRWRWMLLAVVLLAAPAAAVELRLDGELAQGGLVRGEVAPGSTVSLDGMRLQVDPQGRFVFGFGRNSGPDAELVVTGPDGATARRRLTIAPREWRVQRIDGLPPGKVSEFSEADLARIRADSAAIKRARQVGSDLPHAFDDVVWPVTGPITGVFGSQRVLNGQPRSPHRGVDVAAPTGTPVGAMAAGRVSLAADDMFFTGGTVIVDHGHGLNSVYVHLDSVDVEEGQAVARGGRIGTVGATGRATGPHLHWGVYWFERALDPMPLVGPMPES